MKDMKLEWETITIRLMEKGFWTSALSQQMNCVNFLNGGYAALSPSSYLFRKCLSTSEVARLCMPRGVSKLVIIIAGKYT